MLGEKLFASYESVFDLDKGLRDSQTSTNNENLGLLVKKGLKHMQKQHLVIFCVCVLAISSVICQQIHLFYASCGFQKYHKMFNQKIYPRERYHSNKCFVLLGT